MLESYCLLCGEQVYASPNPETWGIQWSNGWVHFKCANDLFEAVRHIQENEEEESENDEQPQADG